MCSISKVRYTLIKTSEHTYDKVIGVLLPRCTHEVQPESVEKDISSVVLYPYCSRHVQWRKDPENEVAKATNGLDFV